MHKQFSCRQISFKTKNYKKSWTFHKSIKEYRNNSFIYVLINPDNFRTAMITSPKLCLDKVIYRLGEFDNFILMLAVFAIFSSKIIKSWIKSHLFFIYRNKIYIYSVRVKFLCDFCASFVFNINPIAFDPLENDISFENKTIF